MPSATPRSPWCIAWHTERAAAWDDRPLRLVAARSCKQLPEKDDGAGETREQNQEPIPDRHDHALYGRQTDRAPKRRRRALTREVYSRLIEGHNNFEIAETFFNSVYCVAFKHRKIRDEHAFVFSPQGDMPTVNVNEVYRSYVQDGSLADLFESLLEDYAFRNPYEDLARDIGNILSVVNNYLAAKFNVATGKVEIQALEHHFFRNKGAYVVGRILSGADSMPFVLPMLVRP